MGLVKLEAAHGMDLRSPVNAVQQSSVSSRGTILRDRGVSVSILTHFSNPERSGSCASLAEPETAAVERVHCLHSAGFFSQFRTSQLRTFCALLTSLLF